jgi:dCMP deaminase
MSRLSHDEYFLKMLALVAARSTCARRAVGAIIVDANNRILSTGYNGVPKGFVHCIDQPCAGATDAQGDTRRCLAIHAEDNALLQCSRLDLAKTLYVSCTPCFQCAKKIANTHISRIVALTHYHDDDAMWVLRTAGIEVNIMEERE